MQKKFDSDRNTEKSILTIPGFSNLLGVDGGANSANERSSQGNLHEREEYAFASSASNIFLMIGPSGSGKTVYCREFLIEALKHKHKCIVISGAMTDRQIRSMFPSSLEHQTVDQVYFINPFFGIGLDKDAIDMASTDFHASHKLDLTLQKVHQMIGGLQAQSQKHPTGNRNGQLNGPCLLLDSLTEFFVLFDEGAVIRFVTELCFLMKQFEGNAIFTLATIPESLSPDPDSHAINSKPSPANTSSQSKGSTVPSNLSRLSSIPTLLSPFFDGILEVSPDQPGRAEEATSKQSRDSNAPARRIRLVSLKGYPLHEPTWVKFRITKEGSLVFGDFSSSSLSCTMCGKAITGRPIMNSEFAFDSENCVETYRRLVGIYGTSVSEMGGLPSQVTNMNFFFVDIVGLSNPVLSVRRQIEKIENLNNLIRTCETFAKTKEPTIVLPTGDGMAIGFFTNLESPLRLAIELQRKINEYNNSASDTKNEGKINYHDDSPFIEFGNGAEEESRDALGVRIGLSSGPVFIVNDVKGNQNVWGPGIILARRVMDIGDNMHILISENLAGSLIGLRDEYKAIIRKIGDYSIKHGQVINIYSAAGRGFGNLQLPTKMIA